MGKCIYQKYKYAYYLSYATLASYVAFVGAAQPTDPIAAAH